MRDRIFISYSRADSAYLDELRTHMSALPDADRLAVWADTGIAPSEQWRQEIDEALTTAAAAVLLLSPSFFASEFIQVNSKAQNRATEMTRLESDQLLASLREAKGDLGQ